MLLSSLEGCGSVLRDLTERAMSERRRGASGGDDLLAAGDGLEGSFSLLTLLWNELVRSGLWSR